MGPERCRRERGELLGEFMLGCADVCQIRQPRAGMPNAARRLAEHECRPYDITNSAGVDARARDCGDRALWDQHDWRLPEGRFLAGWIQDSNLTIVPAGREVGDR
jgi:hypothetical protein